MMVTFNIVRFVLFLFLQGMTTEHLRIGIGKADVTGPASESIAMGYGKRHQVLNGIHTRLWARAYLIHDPVSEKRIMYVVLDACMTSQAVYMSVIKELKKEFGDLYTESNVAIAATHTHTGPGGYFQYFLYSLAAGGFSPETFTAQVDGILEAIRTAHESAQPGTIRLAKGELEGVGVNRSPTAYLSNPKEERDRYLDRVDKTMTLLRFTLINGEDLGILNWYPVHGTSLNNSVTLISGDNKGAASQLFEKAYNREIFIAGFAQENSGDVSPNTEGSYCLDTGLRCDASTSSCHGRNELCHGRGPGWPDSFKSNYIIGEKQYLKAKDLFNLAYQLPQLDPVLDHRSLFLDLSTVSVRDGLNVEKMTCKPAMGYSFAAGTTDGPGAFDFIQGSTQSSIFWDAVSGLLLKCPSSGQKRCQAPKPILLDTGEMHIPSPWQPEVVPLQVLRIGRLFVLCFPGEITTMAGRRLKESVEKILSPQIQDVEVVISGLTNSYSSYVTTFEEYQTQRYEGASTIYGPRTLSAYQREFAQLVQDLIKGTTRRSEVSPPKFDPRLQWPRRSPTFVDRVPPFRHFGQIYKDIKTGWFTDGELVEAQFWVSNPRNSLGVSNHTFLAVEMYNECTKLWEVVAIDDDLSTKFAWRRHRVGIFTYSIATLSWSIPAQIRHLGVYRLRYSGHISCSILSSSYCEISGHSSEFTVNPKLSRRPDSEDMMY